MNLLRKVKYKLTIANGNRSQSPGINLNKKNDIFNEIKNERIVKSTQSLNLLNKSRDNSKNNFESKNEGKRSDMGIKDKIKGFV
jgi:hypothetical protein